MKKLCIFLAALLLFGAGIYVGQLEKSDAIAMAAGVFTFFDDDSMALGAAAPDFDLPGTDGRNHKLSDYADAEVLAIVFTTNHCPTAQAYEQRIQQLASRFTPGQLAVVAISPNDDKAVRLDELGYSEYNDSLAEMKLRSADRGFTFPYLYDGATQQVSHAYSPMATPHVFIFDRERKLRYKGRIDDNENPRKVKNSDARNAIKALLAGKPVEVAETRVFGCSVKWSEKREQVNVTAASWADEDVSLQAMQADDFVSLRSTGKWQLLNIWATWCAPCKQEFPYLVDTYRMYRGRGVEFITVSLDEADQAGAALAFLTEQKASMQNYHFTGSDRDALGDALAADWQGPVPFTALLAPDGRVVYRQHGPFDPIVLRKAIVEHIGRYYF